MQRTSFARMECPIARAAEEIGEGWTLLILREAYKGAQTFSDFEARLPVAPTTLTRRLASLTALGFFERVTYQHAPRRERYALTDKALELMPVLLALGAWGNRWLAPEGALITAVDAASGAPLDIAVVDRRTSRPLRPGEVALAPGPGAKRRVRELLATPLVLGAQPPRPARRRRPFTTGEQA